MLDATDPLAQLLERDKRYKLEAYVFVFEALGFAHNILGLGANRPSEPSSTGTKPSEDPERHLTGQELCEGIRRLALQQFGLMAQCVLESWGVKTTGDFGEIVFNLIATGKMKKTKEDSRADFDNVYEFDAAFRQEFKFEPGESTK